MRRLKILSAIAAIGVIAGPPSLVAETQQCGESKLLAERASTIDSTSENAELRGFSPGSLRSRASTFTGMGLVASPVINIERSLYIRDSQILDAFSLADVMDTLATGLGNDHPSGIELFQDWWRTAARPDSSYAADIGCSEKLINGFRYTCPVEPRAEASLAHISDLRAENNGEPIFKIIGLVNRGDLVFGRQNPDTCGEYRILAAADTVDHPVDDLAIGKFYLSFEAALPNQGNGMCLAVQRFWKSLEHDSTADAGAKLRAFFLQRVGMTKDGTLTNSAAQNADFAFGPVISAANLGLLPEDASRLGIPLTRPVGQIRTNTRDEVAVWLLRQYSFRNTSRGLRITPTSLSATAPAEIFKPTSGCMIGAKTCNALLAEAILSNGSKLATDDIEKISFDLGNRCLEAGEMKTDGGAGDSYAAILAGEDSSSNAAAAALESVATQSGLPFTRFESSYNLDVTSCAGCHRQSVPDHLRHLFANPGKRPINNTNFHLGPTNDFTHSKIARESNSTRYAISPFLQQVLLPWRAFVMEQTLRP